jgi:hypothetical protein
VKVELTKQQCEFLSLAMDQAILQANAEALTRENLIVRQMFEDIKGKMDLATLEAE